MFIHFQKFIHLKKFQNFTENKKIINETLKFIHETKWFE